MGGCALVPSVDLTESEEKMIAEYAAGLLLKYDKNYQGSLREIEDEGDEIEIVENEEAKIPEIPEEDSEQPVYENEVEFSEDLMAEEPNAAEATEYSNTSIAQEIGLDGFDVIYKSFKAYNIYPEEESDDLVFSLQSQNGMELLVLSFGITNNGDERKLCDVLNSDASFRLVINGNERVNANKTILLDDLSSYCEEIDGYGMANAVLVFEVAKGTADNIESLDLVVKKSDVSSTHMLK